MDKILPFMWLNGESEQELRAAVRAVKQMGINAFVIESRVHEDYCGESWFAEMDVVLDEARKNDMRVWLLDDKSYPTGSANGALKAMYPEKNAWRIKMERTDVYGRADGAKILLRANLADGDIVLGAYLARRGTSWDNFENAVDISDGVEGDVLYLDIPEGEYSVFTLIKTHSATSRPYFVDMLNAESVRVLIDAVYEPHYKHYARYFGNTFAGFFSDEPQFTNWHHGYTQAGSLYGCTLGKQGMAYPWSDEVLERLGIPMSDVLALWLNIGDRTSDIRVAYMELVTELYGRNFSGQLAAWCHEHGVLYTGHIIEDMGAHGRLGNSAGHYFRSMTGADLASIDVVLHQIKPFETRCIHFAPIADGFADPLFFDYTLARLATSDARNDARKQGRTCCEIFGAYGWTESMKEMLYLLNHMLVRGINHFIPHAFYHKIGFIDCPPHFYAGDKLNTDKAQKKMFAYMNKMCELFSGGEELLDTVVVYNVQAEWTSRAHTSIDPVNRMLTETQTGFIMADYDTLEKAEIKEDCFVINGYSYKHLVIPSYEYLPTRYTELLARFERFATVSDGSFDENSGTHGLRVYRYGKDGEYYELVVNENSRPTVYRNAHALPYAADYLNGFYRKVGDSVELGGGEAVVLRADSDGLACSEGYVRTPAEPVLDVFVKGFNDSDFKAYKSQAACGFDINARGELPTHSGWVRFDFDADMSGFDGMELEFSGDGCEVQLGDECFVGVDGRVICLPKAHCGKVRVSVTLRNSFAYAIKDFLSTYGFMEACVLKSVALLKKA